MKTFVRVGAMVCLAALMAGGEASADTQARKRKLTFFEQLFGRPSEYRADRPRRNRSGLERWNGDAGETIGLSAPGDAARRKSLAAEADDDPEGDPGLGKGNLTYVPPKLVPLSGLAIADARPADAAAGAIHDQLSGEGVSLRVQPAMRDALLSEYAARGYRPIWLENGTLSPRGAEVLKLLAAAGEEGLEPQLYLPTGLAAFDAPLPEGDAAAMARLDIDLSGAALRYARDASGGQFDPRLLSRYNDVTPPWVPAAQSIKVLAWSPFAADYLKRLHPAHPAYAAMKAELARLRAASAAPADPVAEGGIVKKGESDARLPDVRRRLAELGYAAATDAEDPETLDAELSVQLRLFQKESGIRVTGALGPQTVAALNGAGGQDVAKLLDNMERLRWLPRDLGRRYVFVNQPAFAAQVIEDGKEIWSTRVIIGKPNTQTSVFHDEMEFVVFNPSWGVPPSIIANEYLPKLRRDPAYLDRLGFKVVTQGGKVIPSRAVNWSSYGSKVPFGIHQPPGRKNALGELKFLFPNTHNIYMHDTPSRELFEQDVRAFSHGCVRVQNPRDFAAVLLGWSSEEVARHVKSPASETVRLKQKLPVHITYFTAWPDAAGNIAYFSDIYGRDRAMENARSASLLAAR